jgi:CRISPR/Cas system CSM-associated protein Csm2 small subunit
MSGTKIQWHPGFVAAIDLEFKENRDDLIYEKEYNLSTKPLEIDLLVIKKEPDVQVSNEIGKLFRGHNIVEYKSPEDHLDIDVFYKASAYGCLYKSFGETVDERAANDITISIIRDAKPEGLFRYFKEHGIRVTNPYAGIYYVSDAVLFPTQIVVGKELEQKDHTWIKALSDKVQEQEMRELLEQISNLAHKFDKELADSVLEVSIRANRQVVEELRGGDKMCKALLEIMEPEIDKIRADDARNLIIRSVRSFRDLGASDERIQEILMKNYELSSEEAAAYL